MRAADTDRQQIAVAAGLVHPWPIWLLVPGAALGVVTVGVQVIRNETRN